MTVYYCSASYYDNCDYWSTSGCIPSGTYCHRGACETCDNSYYQCAWANLSGFPPENSIADTCGSSWLCNDKHAYDIPKFSCGTVLWVQDLCNDNGLHVTIADHGPYVCFCETECSSVNLMRIIDLTEAAYIYLEGNLSRGHIPVMIQT